MPFRVSGKNIEIGEALRERINARILDALEKYFDGGYFRATSRSARRPLVFTPNACCISIPASCCAPKRWPPMPISAPTRRRSIWRSGCAAITAGSRTIARRAATTAAAKRHVDDRRTKLRDRRAATGSRRRGAPRSIRSSSPKRPPQLRRFSVSEAVIELDMTGAPVVVFRQPAMAASIWCTAARRKCRLDRSSAGGLDQRPLTAAKSVLMVRRLSSSPSITASPTGPVPCRPPISLRRMRSSRP